MKTLTALVTALTFVGLTGTAFAQCMGSYKPAADQTADAPIVIPPGAAGS